jgi:hypothetical protein
MSVFANGSYVRITLKPGQSLKHYQYRPTDEGWESEGQYWEHCGDRIEHDWLTDGADCDGRLCRGGRLVALSLKSSGFPNWQEADTYQRDYAAESAGY